MVRVVNHVYLALLVEIRRVVNFPRSPYFSEFSISLHKLHLFVAIFEAEAASTKHHQVLSPSRIMQMVLGFYDAGPVLLMSSASRKVPVEFYSGVLSLLLLAVRLCRQVLV
jgi:hypothetical protein